MKRPRNATSEARTRPDENIVRPQAVVSREQPKFRPDVQRGQPQPLINVMYENPRDLPRRERSPERGRVQISSGARFEHPISQPSRSHSSSGSRFEEPMQQSARGQPISSLRFEEDQIPHTRRDVEMRRERDQIYPTSRYEETVDQRRMDVGPDVSQVRGASYPGPRYEQEQFANEGRREVLSPEHVRNQVQPSVGVSYEDDRFDNRAGLLRRDPERFVQPGNSRDGKAFTGQLQLQKVFF